MTTMEQNQITVAIVEKAAALLCAPVVATDARGIVIASSATHLLGAPHEQSERTLHAAVRIPLPLDGETGEIVIAHALDGENVPPRVAQALVELMINQSKLPERRPHQTERKNQFIYDLLHGVATDEAAIMREAKLLGLELQPPRAVILIDARAYILAADAEQGVDDAQIRRRAQIVIGSVISFFHLPSDTICAYLGDGEVAVLKASDSKNLANWIEQNSVADVPNPSWTNFAALRRAGEALLVRLRSDTASPISIGIGRHHPTILGLAHSYQDARVALSLGGRFHGQHRVHSLDTLGIAAFIGIADETTKIELATYLLSPLDREPDLLETLAVFFDVGCSLATTAARLSIHRNTLSYRFDKIALLVGLDPRRFDEAVQLKLALVLRSFYADHVPS